MTTEQPDIDTEIGTDPAVDVTGDSTDNESYHGYSVDDETQPQSTGDSLVDDRGLAEPLDEGYSPPEKWSAGQGFGNTPLEESMGESLDQRVEQEVPEPDPYEVADAEAERGDLAPLVAEDSADGEAVQADVEHADGERAGRLVGRGRGRAHRHREGPRRDRTSASTAPRPVPRRPPSTSSTTRTPSTPGSTTPRSSTRSPTAPSSRARTGPATPVAGPASCPGLPARARSPLLEQPVLLDQRERQRPVARRPRTAR